MNHSNKDIESETKCCSDIDIDSETKYCSNNNIDSKAECDPVQILIITLPNGETMIQPDIGKIFPQLAKYLDDPIKKYHINELYLMLSGSANHMNPNYFSKIIIKSMTRDEIRKNVMYHLDKIIDTDTDYTYTQQRDQINDMCDNLTKLCCDFLDGVNPLSIRLEASFSLPHYDSVRFNEIFQRFCHQVFDEREMDHCDFAQIIYDFYKCRFICSCVDNGIYDSIFYEFRDHRWVHVEDYRSLLQNLIIDQIVPLITRQCSGAFAFTQNNCKKIMKYVVNQIDKTDDMKMKKIIRLCLQKFHDLRFATKLDSKKHLLGFENGVMDLNEQKFRNGLPWDYVSLSVGYQWKEFDPMDPLFDQKVKKIHLFLSQIHVEEEMVRYLMMFITQVLSGIQDQQIHTWYGKASNGKSAFAKMIRQILGEYFGTVTYDCLIQDIKKKDKSEQILARQRAKRLILIQESEYGQVLDIKKMIDYTIAGSINPQRREMWFKPCFTMLMIHSDKLQITETKQSVIDKVLMVPFESEFVDMEHQILKPGQFLKNHRIWEELEPLIQPLMWLILRKYYPMYKNNGVQIPEKISGYAKNNNMLMVSKQNKTKQNKTKNR
jgi:hypothetical protein